MKSSAYKTILQEYKTYLQTLNFASSTVRDYPNFVREFLLFSEEKGQSNLQQLTLAFTKQYFSYLETRPHKRNVNDTLSISYLNSNFLAIDKFFEFLHQVGMSNAPSPLKYHIKVQRKKPIKILNQQEIKELYNVIPHTFLDYSFAYRTARQNVVRLVLDLCYGCGLRRSELQNVQLKDVDFDRKRIYIRQGKNYKDRYVPMPPKVYKNTQDFVYNYRKSVLDRRPLYLYPYKETDSILRGLLKQCSSALQAKKPTLHTLRHSIATHLLQNGMSIDNISQFLGHNGLEATQIYTHVERLDTQE